MLPTWVATLSNKRKLKYLQKRIGIEQNYWSICIDPLIFGQNGVKI